MQPPAAVAQWHRVVDTGDLSLLDDLLSDAVTFHSPAVFATQQGRALTTAYLTAAMDVLGPSLSYQHEWYDEYRAVLEFRTELDGRSVHGVDMLTWDATGRLTDLTVMVRPFRALQTVIEHMGARLAAAGAQP